MKTIKIIFFDIDGTLINMNKKQISQKMLETLKRLKENQIRICLATGRTPMSWPHFDGIEFDAFLTFNGSYCFTKDQDISSFPIPSYDVQQIIQNAKKLHRPLSIATKNRIASNGKDDDLVQYFDFAKMKVEVADDFNEVAKDEVYQIMVGCREKDYSILMDNVENAKITAWWDRAVDIIPAQSGKGIGIQKILDYYQLDTSQALAFGDGNNDIEMLQTVGTGVAMGNASSQVKEIADDICGHVCDDGIYHYCLLHHLI